MSRRTKLLITALFVVLLAIPLVYVVYSWHVPDPLRFRVVAHEFERDLDFGGSFNWYHIEVRNTAPVPVYLSTGILYRNGVDVPAQGKHLSLLQEADYPRPAELYGPAYIPAHGTWHGRAHVWLDNGETLDLGKVNILCYYDSHSKKEILNRYRSLCDLLPESISEKLPYGSSQFAQVTLEVGFTKSIDTTPEPPAAVPAGAAAAR